MKSLKIPSGWRRLKDSEVIRKTDEFMFPNDSKLWNPDSAYTGYTVGFANKRLLKGSRIFQIFIRRKRKTK